MCSLHSRVQAGASDYQRQIMGAQARPPSRAANEAGRPGGNEPTLLNRGDGSFRSRHSYGQGSDSASIAVGDLTGDGRSDLATADESPGAVSVFANRGRGFAEKLDYPTGKTPSLTIGDLNGDGRLDLASANFIADTASPPCC